MTDAMYLILLHQLLFQGMFFTKNFTLKNKLGLPVRGNNPEANLAIAFLVLFIGVSLYLAASDVSTATTLLAPGFAWSVSLLLMLACTVVGFASLRDLGDSWRIGIIEEEQTALVENGIYGRTRNPYFVSYLLMLGAYTLLLQSGLLLVMAALGWLLVHRMILKEERHLEAVHGDSYRRYCSRVPRYLW